MTRRFWTLESRLLLLVVALLAAFALRLLAAPRPASGKPPKPPTSPARHGRDMRVIDGAWRFLADPDQKGEGSGWERAAPSDAKEINVPGLWTDHVAPNYAGAAWYWRAFETPSGWSGQTVRLRFEAVADKARVWLNGEKLGEHSGGATPFEFNVTRILKIGQQNTLAVRVEGDTRAGAGIWQGVLLLAHDEAYIEDVFPQADAVGRVTAPIVLLNTSNKSGDATLEARIVAVDTPTKDLKKTQQTLHLTPGRNLTTLLTSVRGKNLHLWSPDSPFLYALQLAFRQGDDVLDTQEDQFGFREFGLKEGAITLNGETLPVKAIAPEPTQPVVIATTDDSQRALESLRRVKSAGVNVIHLAAPPPAMLIAADQAGLLVVESASRHPESPQEAADELRTLIVRDHAHACILAWNLGAADTATARAVRDLDPTRFLLVGPAASPRLWPPNQNEAMAVAPPPGLLPPR